MAKSKVTGGGGVAAAVPQRKVVAAIVNVQRVIATVHILSSLLCGEEKSHNPPHEVLRVHC
jgi:hypothetical protein